MDAANLEGLSTVLATLLTVMTSAAAWQYWTSRDKRKHQQAREARVDSNLVRDELRERVAILEERLDTAQKEKDTMSQRLAEVASLLAEYRVRIEYLEHENERLRAGSVNA